MRARRFVISSVATVALAAGGVAVTAGTASASSVTCQQNALNRYNYYGHLANLDFSSSVADYAAGDFDGGALWFNAYLQDSASAAMWLDRYNACNLREP